MRNAFKKLTAVFSAFAILIICVSFGGATEVKRYFGDVDNDGTVSADDARTALLCALGISGGEIYGEDYNCADIDRDGTVTIADARLILRTSCELVSPVLMDVTEFDPHEKDFIKLVNAERCKSVDLNTLIFSDELCKAAQKASKDFCENTGTAFVGSDGGYYYKLLSDSGIKFTFADKIITESGSGYTGAFNKMLNNTQSRKALLSGNFNKIGVGGYSSDGRTFYWCVFLIK